MFRKFIKFKCQKRAFLVYFAIALPVLFMFIGAAADFGWLYYNQSRLQNAADAAVIVGARQLTADEQSLSDYTYTTFISNNEEKLRRLIDEDIRVTKRSSRAGDEAAITYIKRNISQSLKTTLAVEGTDYTGDWNPAGELSQSNLTILNADSLNDNSDVTFQSRIYGTDAKDYESLYYTIVLSEEIPHLFSIMDNFNFAKFTAKVMATAKIHHIMHGENLHDQMVLKKIAETYVDWDIIRQAKRDEATANNITLTDSEANQAADKRCVLTAGAYYKAGNHYRTEISILNGYGFKASTNYANTDSSIEQTQFDDLFIDFRAELYPNVDNVDIDLVSYPFKNNRDWIFGDVEKKDKTKDLNPQSYEYRIHYPLNINAVYPVIKEKLTAENPYHCLYAFIEREPVRKKSEYLTYNKENKDVILKDRKNMSSVRQIIINVNVSNFNAEKYRPIVFFYDGPEKGHPDNVDENGRHIRDSQPVILNFYADFRGILFAPNSPVAINGNNYNFEGFVVAKEFVQIMEEKDYVPISYTETFTETFTETVEVEEPVETGNTEETGDTEGTGNTEEPAKPTIRIETITKTITKTKTYTGYINKDADWIDITDDEDKPGHEVLQVTYQVQKEDGKGFESKNGYVNKANLRTEYDSYKYPYKVTAGTGTFYVNSLNNIKPTEDEVKDIVVYKINTEATGSPLLNATGELISEQEGNPLFDENGEVLKDENGNPLLETETRKNEDDEEVEVPKKFKIPKTIYYKVTGESIKDSKGNTVSVQYSDAKGNKNPLMIDDHGNVQYKCVITPSGKIYTEGNPYQPTDFLNTFSDDLTFEGNPFKLASQKYNSFKNVGLVNYSYLENTEYGKLIEDEDKDPSDYVPYEATDVFYTTERSKHIE